MMIKERQSYDREFKQKAVEPSFARGNAKEIRTNRIDRIFDFIKVDNIRGFDLLQQVRV